MIIKGYYPLLSLTVAIVLCIVFDAWIQYGFTIDALCIAFCNIFIVFALYAFIITMITLLRRAISPKTVSAESIEFNPKTISQSTPMPGGGKLLSGVEPPPESDVFKNQTVQTGSSDDGGTGQGK